MIVLSDKQIDPTVNPLGGLMPSLRSAAIHLQRWADVRGLRRARGRPIGAAALARRVMGPLAQPITRPEPTTAPASKLACAPAAQPPLR